MMLLSLIRFAAKGWIYELYINPGFFFSYYGFAWIQPLGNWTYLLFFVCGLSAIFVALGFRYRLAIICFFLSFTYIELMDKTTYLNHYYFISVLSFSMIFLPAHAYFSLDAHRNPRLKSQFVPAWSIHSVKLLISIVYLYAGFSKLNSDWLFAAMPLSLWLPAHASIPVLGQLLQQKWIAFGFSWAGALYDLSIPFLLLMSRTRTSGFIFVVVFHLLTLILFPIGMFPLIMIVNALIFFDADFHRRLLQGASALFNIQISTFNNGALYSFSNHLWKKCTLIIIGAFFLIQLLFPFRYLLYPGELFWTEEGYRFSWRVMLMEKAGTAQFRVVDVDNNQQVLVDNSQHLTVFQEKQMSTQPDFILEYAHYLKNYYEQKGIHNPEVYVDSFVTLNGRMSRRFVDASIDLAKVARSLEHKEWILSSPM